MKITEQNSLFTEVAVEESATVNGGDTYTATLNDDGSITLFTLAGYFQLKDITLTSNSVAS